MLFVPGRSEAEDLLTPEDSVYVRIAYIEEAARATGPGTQLLTRGMAWAREQDYRHCTLNFFAGNLIGARFWLRRGFRPLSLRLERRIDERISWAEGSNEAG
jgi:GNAT superfamily N-acetyltransferase